MIPFIRSFTELMALTDSRDVQRDLSIKTEISQSKVDSAQNKRDIRLLDKNEVMLPNLPKIIRHKWIQNKDSVSKFINELDYNNQIQSSYDLTLLERQNKRNQQDAA